MIYGIIGMVVGLMMGLTGAGGALISIPLFINLLQLSLKEATILSLLAVILGTSINLLSQKHSIDKKIVLSFFSFGAIGNLLSIKIKSSTPDLIVALLLTAITIFSLWNIWRPSQIKSGHAHVNFIKLAIIGFFLGIITTLTGLGGGVLLVPILMSFGKNYAEAIPTSLATIFLISTVSFLLQLKTGLELISFLEIGFIALGTLSSFLLLKIILKKIDPTKTEFIRKTVFTMVTIYSIGTVLFKTR